MDYEKAYKAAKRLAAHWIESGCEVTERILLETIFPELKESENERIIKNLQTCLHCGKTHGMVNDDEYLVCKNYLEKQKEPIPIPDKFSGLKSLMLQYFQSAANRTDDAEIEDDTDLWGRKILEYVWKQEEKQKEQKVDVDKLCRDIYQSGYNDGYQHGKEDAQKEQKPAEWSEEDEKILNEIIETIEATRVEASRDLPNCSVLIESYWTMLRWLKSLRPQSTQLKEAYKDGFQAARNAIALAFMQYCDKIRPNGKMCLSNGECEEIEKAFLIGDWEKIERYFHKYQWKPSEEQMRAVFDASERNDKLGSVLRNLYDDLKKL